MKQFNLLFTVLFLLIFSLGANAQSKAGADYFAGTWNVLVKGTPNGDARMFFVLDNKDSKLSGIVQDSTGKEMTKITSTELTDSSVTIYFTTQGYDVNLLMTKKTDDHAIGSLMSMFDAEADRVKK